MKVKTILGVALILAGIGLIAWAGATGWKNIGPSLTSAPTPLWQAEPLIPTALPPPPAVSSQTSRSTPTLSLLLSPSPNALKRFGVGVPHPPLAEEVTEKLDLGWYVTWSVFEHPPRREGIEFWQMIRLHEDGFHPNKATIQRAAQANPGATWLVGNEPDVLWQDNVTPARYAEWYHEIYYLLKETDPTCQVVMGGVSQPTPLRLQYLVMILSFYQTRYGEAMPIDVWNIHNFILREEHGSWGVDIPPGLTTEQGILYEVEDHDDLEVFKAQIINFRQWMADHGQQDKPLIVSEYGILMPAEYGFNPERVQRFLYGTYEFMLNATDKQIGYPGDNNHLVQRWAWYSLSDNRYSTGNLIDFTTGDLTSLGKAHQAFIFGLP